jgi:hypothetical protein
MSKTQREWDRSFGGSGFGGTDEWDGVFGERVSQVPGVRRCRLEVPAHISGRKRHRASGARRKIGWGWQ